eukprot:CAMPEP_0117500992 /NCGR_PEP_ID=MMETSP0784-20121206/23065_1 /TAXON_ID=39447 /ORGANISM="" /LENGTH=133 /DNA_ID=CAMNT_0005296225 /DNA_START=77 /DNA_END=479 /DNA_ORIENTATION=+
MANRCLSQHLPLPLKPLPLPPPLSPFRSFAVNGASPRWALNQLRIIWSFSGIDKGGSPHAARRFSSSSMSLYTPTLTTGDLSRFLGGDFELELDGDLAAYPACPAFPATFCHVTVCHVTLTLTLTSAWRTRTK